MKAKQQLVSLVLVVAVVVLLGIALHRREADRWTAGEDAVVGRLVLPELVVNHVAEVHIRDARDSLTLTREDGRWGVVDVGGYPVDFQRLRTLLLELKDVTFAQSVDGGDRFLERLNLLPPTGETIASGVLLELIDERGETLHSLVLGRNHYRESGGDSPFGGNWPQGRYVRVEPDGVVGLVAHTFSSVTPERARWLQRDFFRIGRKQSIAMLENGETVWAFSRPDEGAALAFVGELPAGKQIAADAVGNLDNALAHASFADVLGRDVDAAATGLDNPRICRIVDLDGIQYDLHIGATSDKGRHLRVVVTDTGPEQRQPADDESEEAAAAADDTFARHLRERREKVEELAARLHGWTYLVNLHVLSDIDKAREDFFADPPEPTPEAE